LCRLGSAWNSLVTRFSRSLSLEAYAKVKPVIEVSLFVVVVVAAFAEGEAPC
jgi:hypothetical protein